MATSPNTQNYFVGKGILSFRAEGAGEYRDLGNAPTFEIEMDIEELEHYSSRTGVRTRDRTEVLSQTGSINVTLDEITPENLAMALLGTVDTDTDGSKVVAGMEQTSVRGAVRLVGTNAIGNKFQVDIPVASFRPDGAIGFIGDDWGTISLTGTIEKQDNAAAFTVREILDTETPATETSTGG